MQGSGVGVRSRKGLRERQNVEEAVKESSLSHEFQSPEEYHTPAIWVANQIAFFSGSYKRLSYISLVSRSNQICGG